MHEDGFDNIRNTMNREEQAVLDLVLRLQEMEESSQESSDRKTVLSFDEGLSANDILRLVLRGDKSALPLPKEEQYVGFGWSIVRKEEFKGEMEERTVAGTNDTRLLSVNEDGKRALKIMANTGGFEGMEKELNVVLNDINYPFLVTDRRGFEFKNKAFGD